MAQEQGMAESWQPRCPQDHIPKASGGQNHGPPVGAALLGQGVSGLRSLEAISKEDLSGRLVLVTLGNRTAVLDPFSGVRSALYQLCDATIRPFCVATHRPYPLQELDRLGEKKGGSDPKSGADPVANKLVSSAWFDAGHVICDEAKPDTALESLLTDVLGRGPATVILLSASPAAVFRVYGAHAASLGGALLPFVSLGSRMTPTGSSPGAFEALLTGHSKALANGKALLCLGLQREQNRSGDYDLALRYGVSIVEFMHLLGVWRHALNGREVSPLEHLHDHCDRLSSLTWQRERTGLHAAFSLDVLNDGTRSRVDAAGETVRSAFGCSLQDLGGVLTYLGRTKMTRVLHIIAANSEDVADPGTANMVATLLYKLALLRNEYSES